MSSWSSTDQTVEMRPIKAGPSANGLTIVEGGLKAGETRDHQQRVPAA